MAIGTPVNLGANGVASATSLAITTGNAITAGDTVIVWFYCAATGGTVATLTDTAGNTYNLLASFASVAPLIQVYTCVNATSMASSSSISATFNGSAQRHGMAAYTISGLINPNNADLHTIGTANKSQFTTSTTTVSIPINNSYSNIMLMLEVLVAGSSYGTVTHSPSFTQLGGTATNAFMSPAYFITSTTASITSVQSWQTGQIAGVFAFALAGKPATNTSRQAQEGLTGVGA